MFIVRKKCGSTKFSPTNEPVDDKSIELATKQTHEYISLETNLMIKSNDDGRDNEEQSEVEENEEQEEDMEQKYENMTNEEEEEEGMEQQYEDMKESIQDNNKEGEKREREIKVEMREGPMAHESPIVAVYAITSKKN